MDSAWKGWSLEKHSPRRIGDSQPDAHTAGLAGLEPEAYIRIGFRAVISLNVVNPQAQDLRDTAGKFGRVRQGGKCRNPSRSGSIAPQKC